MTTSPAPTRSALTVADIVAGYDNDLYLGWGYLNARSGEAAEIVAFADAIVLEVANERRWTPAELFAWLNSKLGRWFGDEVFGGYRRSSTEVRAVAERHGLFDITQIV